MRLTKTIALALALVAIIAGTASSAWRPMRLGSGAFFDINAIEEIYIAGGTFIVWADRGDTLQVPPGLATNVQNTALILARNPNEWIRTEPGRIVNFGVSRWGRYDIGSETLTIGWPDGGIEGFSGAELDSIRAVRGVIRTLAIPAR